MKSLKITRADSLGLLAATLLAISAGVVRAGDYQYSTNTDGTITITNYTGSGGDISIPSMIDGLTVGSIGGRYSPPPVIGWVGAFTHNLTLTSVTIPDSLTNIGDYAFEICANMTNVTISDNVTSIGDQAFAWCYGLTSVYFKGNAPTAYSSAFYSVPNATVYYLPGTTGWSTNFDGCSATIWRPQLSGSSISSNQFSFDINWVSGMAVVVEASTNLPASAWLPLQSNTLTADSSLFCDSQSPIYRSRFYRVIWQP